jgi:hypothetical protein
LFLPLITVIFHGVIFQFMKNKRNVLYLLVIFNVTREREIQNDEIADCVCIVQCAVTSKTQKYSNSPTCM